MMAFSPYLTFNENIDLMASQAKIATRILAEKALNEVCDAWSYPDPFAEERYVVIPTQHTLNVMKACRESAQAQKQA